MQFKNLIELGGIDLCLEKISLGMDHWRVFFIIYLHRKLNCDLNV